MFEVAARWGCTPTDITEWAAMERLQLMTSASLVQTDGAPLAGLIELHAADLMPMFRRDGSGPHEVRIHRVRAQGAKEWTFITHPPDGLIVAKPDILISADEVSRFEEENALARPATAPATFTGAPTAYRPAQPNYKYDWDAMYLAVIQRIHEHGLPETQSEFVGEFQEWFARRDAKGEAPDERTIRRRLNPIWRTLRETV